MMSQEEAQKKIIALQNTEISAQTQETLNKPLQLENGLEAKDKEFLNMVEDKITKGEIQLFQPSTLLNKPVYENLGEQDQSKADLDAFNILTSIREIHKLWQAGHQETYQLANLVHKIRLTKENLENIGGDIFII